MKMKLRKICSSIFLCAWSCASFATAYDLPAANESIIGHIQQSSTHYGETPATIAQQYDLGFNALENANPHLNLNAGVAGGSSMQIPTQHLLPNEARKGIVINLAEMRMYYYLPDSNKVLTYPIGIGKIGKTIPIAPAKITHKTVNPTWTPPDDIREFNMQQGIVLPRVMPPGPDNPLGPYAIYISIPTYLIHSTIFPESIGRRASFGCIRMYESDIKEFFPIIQKGIPVAIINMPVKAGWENDRLYLEAHPSLEEHSTNFNTSLPGMVHLLSNVSKDQNVLIDWQMVSFLAKQRDGIPHEVGMRIP